MSTNNRKLDQLKADFGFAQNPSLEHARLFNELVAIENSEGMTRDVKTAARHAQCAMTMLGKLNGGMKVEERDQKRTLNKAFRALNTIIESPKAFKSFESDGVRDDVVNFRNKVEAVVEPS